MSPPGVLVTPGLVQGLLLTGLPGDRTRHLCCGSTCHFRRTVLARQPKHRAPLSRAAVPAHLPSCSCPTPSPLPRGVWGALRPSPQISPFASRSESVLLLLMRMHLPRLPPPPRLLLSPDKELFRFTVGTQRTRSCKDAFFLLLLHCKGQSCCHQPALLWCSLKDT